MGTRGVPRYTVFTGTLKEWNATQGNKYKIEGPTRIVHDADVSYGLIAVDEDNMIVAEENSKSASSTICIVYDTPQPKC